MSPSTTLDGPMSANVSAKELAFVSLDLEVTSVCDAVCGFCPREFMPDKKSFISMDLVKRVAEDIHERPGFSVTLCGIGEPTLPGRWACGVLNVTGPMVSVRP